MMVLNFIEGYEMKEVKGERIGMSIFVRVKGEGKRWRKCKA